MISIEDAFIDVAALEEMVGFDINQFPVFELDQWGAAIRDIFKVLGVNLADHNQSQAAFAGAYLVSSALIPGSNLNTDGLKATTEILHNLMDRTRSAI